MPKNQERSISDVQVVVTGATNGIGKEIARALVRRGAAVTMVARNESKARDTADELAAEPGAIGTPAYVIGDLADLASVRTATDELHRRLDRIDVLVNNAGILTYNDQPTVDGFDPTIATNHLGPFLLTSRLRDLLEAGSPARIVVTASEAHRFASKVDPETLADPRRYGSAIDSQLVYGESKRLNILFTAQLATELEGTGITANCFCPGAVASGFNRESRFATRAGDLLSRTPIIRTPLQGARMGIRLALDPSLENISGGFFTSTPGARLLPTVGARKNAELRQRIWEKSARLVDDA